MSRKIVIHSCNECPFKEEKSHYTLVAAIPMCKKANQLLPYREETHSKRNIAIPLGDIPDWCPLEKDEDFSDLV